MPERYRVITVEGAFHGRTLATIAAGGQEKHLKGFDPMVDGFDQVAFGNLNELRAAITAETGGHPDRAGAGRGRHARRRRPNICGRCARSPTSSACCCSSTRCNAAWAAPASCSPMNGPASKPDIVATAKGIGGGFPMGACLATEKVAAALDRRQPRQHLRRQSAGDGGAAMPCSTSCWPTDSSPTSSAWRPAAASGCEALVRRYPAVFADVRGMGLMLGLKCVVPNTEMVNRRCARPGC